MADQAVIAQMLTESATALGAFRRAVADDLGDLALFHDVEPSRELLDALKRQPGGFALGLNLRSPTGAEALALMDAALAALPAVAEARVMDELAADYADIYLTHAYRASPYESVWLDDDHLMSQEPMFQVRAYYLRHGLTAANWRVRPDDHLTLQLQFLARLFSSETGDVLPEAACFMDEHLLRWLPQFGQRVAERCRTAYFAAVALLTAAYCEEIRELLASILGQPRPSAEDIASRMKQRRQPPPAPVAFVPGTGPSW
ncbi:MAG: molecular chaperone TorD family protein [Candidatus Competibacteraceae bacterium]|nr:molecular chaperone TorD family protein [Candidatus Competibacteraceae bacterium]